MASSRRMRFQIYADVLWAIHSIVRCGQSVSLYRIERIAALPHSRLRNVLTELRDLEFLNGGLQITERGYTFLADVSNRVVPVLRKYGFWDGHL